MSDPIIKDLENVGRELLAEGASQSLALIANQITLAATEFKSIGSVVAKLGKQIVTKMAEVTRRMTAGELTADDAEDILGVYWLGLANLEHALENESERNSFLRGRSMLAGAQQIAFGLVTAGVSLAAPIAGELLGRGLAKLTSEFDT